MVKAKQPKDVLSVRHSRLNSENNRAMQKVSFTDNRSETKQRLELKATMANQVVQRQYYDATNNTVTERPEETNAIAAAKQKEKDDAPIKGYPISRFTAHHKYPWNKIKDDIETAFVAPKTSQSLKALDNLEQFSGKSIPTTREKFLNSVDHRKNTYQSKTSQFDKWIQEVCWVPGNIFIGPLSDQRIDDPSKRQGNNDFDAHYSRRRRMSMRSEQLSDIFKNGGLTTNQVHIQNNSVGGYDPDEWQSHGMGEGALLNPLLYSQKNDPYFEENTFPFNVTTNPVDINNHANDNFSFEVVTPDNITMAKVGYTKVNMGPAKDKAVKTDPVLTKTENNQNYYQITVATESQYILQNFKAGLKKDSGPKKAVDLTGVRIRRP